MTILTTILTLLLFTGQVWALEECRDWGEIGCVCGDSTQIHLCADCGSGDFDARSLCDQACAGRGASTARTTCNARPGDFTTGACWDADPTNDALDVRCTNGGDGVTCGSRHDVVDYAVQVCGQGNVASFEVREDGCTPGLGPFAPGPANLTCSALLEQALNVCRDLPTATDALRVLYKAVGR